MHGNTSIVNTFCAKFLDSAAPESFKLGDCKTKYTVNFDITPYSLLIIVDI